MSDYNQYAMPDEIFFCELCNSFHAGLMAFASHTAKEHDMSATVYWEKHPYFTFEDYQKVCLNPHEKSYRGCSPQCCIYTRCTAKKVFQDGRIASFVETL